MTRLSALPTFSSDCDKDDSAKQTVQIGTGHERGMPTVFPRVCWRYYRSEHVSQDPLLVVTADNELANKDRPRPWNPAGYSAKDRGNLSFAGDEREQRIEIRRIQGLRVRGPRGSAVCCVCCCLFGCVISGASAASLRNLWRCMAPLSCHSPTLPTRANSWANQQRALTLVNS